MCSERRPPLQAVSEVVAANDQVSREALAVAGDDLCGHAGIGRTALLAHAVQVTTLHACVFYIEKTDELTAYWHLHSCKSFRFVERTIRASPRTCTRRRQRASAGRGHTCCLAYHHGISPALSNTHTLGQTCAAVAFKLAGSHRRMI